MNLSQMMIESKVGNLYLIATEKGLEGVFWKKQNWPKTKRGSDIGKSILKLAALQIEEYLNGRRKEFMLP